MQIWRGDDPVLYPFVASEKMRRGAGGNDAEVYRYDSSQATWRRVGDGRDEHLIPLGLESGDFVGFSQRAGPNGTQEFTARLWANGRDVASTVVEWSHAPVVFDVRRGGPILYFEDGHWWRYEPAAGRRVNLTARSGGPWSASAVGQATSGFFPAMIPEMRTDGSILLGDRYDIYLSCAGDALTRLTDGAHEQTEFRPIVPDYPLEPDPNLPAYFTTFNEKTKAAGFAVFEPGAPRIRRLYRDDSRLFDPARHIRSTLYPAPLLVSRDGNRALFRRESFSEPPNLFVADLEFKSVRQVTRLNAVPRDDTWGKSELVTYKVRGETMQGILVSPALLEQGKAYPLVTIVYERESDDLHLFKPPDVDDPQDERTWSRAGYYVLKPDIRYALGDPGPTIIESIEAAVEAALGRAPINSERVGLIGASYGGYETLLALSKSKKFAAGVAINPLTDLISHHGSIQTAYSRPAWEDVELGQGRMGVPVGADPVRYVRNSPAHQADSVERPVLLAHGDADLVVDWRQSLEMYLALRRRGKSVIFLKYPGEGHGIRGLKAGPDLARRVHHFFDVHLHQAEAEAWLVRPQ